MGVDAEVLLLGPFKEVVERGKEALANAEDAGEENAELSRLMLKAAQGVVKEGERALKRLQPLWDGQIEKYGDAFRDGLGQNGMDARVLSPQSPLSPHPQPMLTLGRGRGRQEKKAGGPPV